MFQLGAILAIGYNLVNWFLHNNNFSTSQWSFLVIDVEVYTIGLDYMNHLRVSLNFLFDSHHPYLAHLLPGCSKVYDGIKLFHVYNEESSFLIFTKRHVPSISLRELLIKFTDKPVSKELLRPVSSSVWGHISRRPTEV